MLLSSPKGTKKWTLTAYIVKVHTEITDSTATILKAFTSEPIIFISSISESRLSLLYRNSLAKTIYVLGILIFFEDFSIQPLA